jgi:hypothetical protein
MGEQTTRPIATPPPRHQPIPENDAGRGDGLAGRADVARPRFQWHLQPQPRVDLGDGPAGLAAGAAGGETY